VTAFTPTRLGAALALLAGVAFAIQPVVGQVALDGGAAIASLLGWRYAIAAAVLAAVSRRRLRTIPPRVAALAFGLGLVLYAADAGLFYAALDRTSAPFATLLHYAHLAVVVGTAALMGRERLDARRACALVGALLGVALVGGGGSVDMLGIVLALASAGAYSAYILVSDRLLREVDPIAFATLLTAGAATSFLLFGASTGDLLVLGGPTGIAAVLSGALVGSVFAVSAFLAAIRLVGPGTASLLVTVEVPVGLTLAGLVLGEGLSVAQLAGAALVVGTIVLLQVRVELPRRQRLGEVHVLPVSSSGGEPADALAT
jgi:drug/metabolite transporter (DMT)-like permease